MKTFRETFRDVTTETAGIPAPETEARVFALRRRVRRYSREEIADELAPGGFSALEAQNLRRRLAAIRERGEMPASRWNEPRNS
jgi:hypothetical protein